MVNKSKGKNTKMSAKTEVGTVDSNLIQDIPLKDILADFEWNSRGQAWRKVGQPAAEAKDGAKTSEGHSIVELAASISERGQDDPIVVRLNTTKSKEKYSVVVGFRRYEATTRNANGDKSATIRAVVRVLSEAQARTLNLTENVARENLSIADLAWGFSETKKAYAAAGTPISNNTLSKIIGKNQAWVNQLVGIAEKGTAVAVEVNGSSVPMVEAWRDAEKPLPANVMSRVLGKKTPEEQIQAYAEETKKYSEKAGEPDPHAWLESAKEKAEKSGFLLGLLKAEGHISFKGSAWVAKCIRDLAKFKADKTPEYKEGATEAQIAKIVKAAISGIERGEAEPARLEAEAEEHAAKEAEKKEKANAALKKAGKEAKEKNSAAHAN